MLLQLHSIKKISIRKTQKITQDKHRKRCFKVAYSAAGKSFWFRDIEATFLGCNAFTVWLEHCKLTKDMSLW